ncbi:MAG: beta-glucosidase BglX [Verrucomicrobiota bacterium]
MRISPVSTWMLMAMTALGAEPAIYRDGWIDFDKNGARDVYEDPSQPVDRRVDDLLSRMTLDEKIGQLLQEHREQDAVKQFGSRLRAGAIGSFLDGSELIETPGPRNALQRVAVEESRLGIPLIFGHDSIHGFRTIFPIPLAMASAWDPALFERASVISARETAAVGIDWTFAPMVDLARDPRWGRIAEGYGEDPWLGTLYAAAEVRGFQGTNPAAPDRLVACLKHYVGYGAAEGGRDYNTTEISEYTLRNFYLPQFKSGVDAGAWTVMSAFNLLPGSPASANRHTLTEILRDEWHFPGFVVSDWTAVEELMPHGVAGTGADAARLALVAGVDMEMVSSNYPNTLAAQVKDGRIPESIITEAARRVLKVKFVKGLFEHPYVDETLYKTAFLRPDAVALAREAAARSCVLLRNEHGILPLGPGSKKIALIGPFGDATGDLLGCWAARGRAEDAVSIAAALKSRLPSTAELRVVHGCDATSTGRMIHLLDGSQVEDRTAPPAGPGPSIPAAVAAAKWADTIILALGEPAGWSGENSSRSSLDITGRQQELFDAVCKLGKPVIVILINGRPLAVPALQEQAAAILEAWDPGVQGGPGVVDVLFGDAEPQGRLTVSFPRSLGQVPVYYNHYNTGRPDMGKYVDGPREPLYPFGFGLAYTAFEWSPVTLGSARLEAHGSLRASVAVRNTGSRAGTEVVQLYVRAPAAPDAPRPVRELRGFKKVKLQPGESGVVDFEISPHDLGYVDVSGRNQVQPGSYELWLAPDSASGKPVAFELAPAQ